MSPLLIIVLLLLLLFLWLLVLRIRVIIDTEQALYEVRLRPLARANLVIDDERITYDWRILFFHKEGELIPALLKSKVKDSKTVEHQISDLAKDEKKKTSDRRRMSLKKGLELGRSMLSSFKVNRFRLFLNTDDAIYNAWLYPVFTFWRSKGQDVELRFFGSSALVVDIENALHRVLGAIFYNYLIKPLKS